ncbi:MAG: TIM barrel protein [Sphingobium sp.]
MQTVFALPPVEHVRLAADLGCGSISTGLHAFPFNPEGYSQVSLGDDPIARREMIAVMRDLGVVIGLGEGCNIRPGMDMSVYAPDLDILCELGVKLVNAVSLDPDLSRSFDQFARFAEMAEARGMRSSVELCPALTIPDLETALQVVRHVGRPGFGLLIDTMHLCSSGSGARELAALDPAMIFYVQICDALLAPQGSDYSDEASNRLSPGEGELPLAALLAQIPRDVIISVEMPQRRRADAGVGPRERAAQAIDATRRLLSLREGNA